MKLKITRIEIVIEGVPSPEETTTLPTKTVLTRDETHAWKITGDTIMYPKHMRFMAELNDMARDMDK